MTASESLAGVPAASLQVGALPDAVPPLAEIQDRLRRVRIEMDAAGLQVLVLSGENNVFYFSGYRTLSWTSNSRPVFFVIGLEEALLVGSATEERNLATAVRPFSARFYRGFIAEAVPVIVHACQELGCGTVRGIGLDYGIDCYGRGSLALLDSLSRDLPGVRLVEAAAVIWAVRQLKSAFEAKLKQTSFHIADKAFDQALQQMQLGWSETDLFRLIQSGVVNAGADRADPFPVLFGTSEFAYNRPPSARRLAPGDYIWTDFRSSFGGYPADRNRIARAGMPSAAEQGVYARVRQVTIDLCNGIRPGVTGGDIYSRFETLWRASDLGPLYSRVSRIGHGGGLDLTEPPSIMPGSGHVIQCGMILHLEPKIEVLGGVFQCEEVILVGDIKNIFLADLSPEEIPVVA
jgi:Xaa-Pro aminopeptidase